VDSEEHTIYYCPECQTGGKTANSNWGFKGRGWMKSRWLAPERRDDAEEAGVRRQR